jgi:hypothetical protein
MSGGAQAHLIEATDGITYVVKFLNNPQHRRIVINEWITSMILGHLGISTPASVIINIAPNFIRNNPEVYLQIRSGQSPPSRGPHFGSQFLGESNQIAFYPYLPSTAVGSVANISHFCGVLVVDKWLGNTDSRQVVFNKVPGVHSPSFVAQMIDNGNVFDGGNWRFEDSPLRGPYFGKVYEQVRSLDAFEPWLTAVANFPEKVIKDTFEGMPASWRFGDTDAAFEILLNQLMRRRRRVSDLIYACRDQPAHPFPNWDSAALGAFVP